MRVIKQGKLPLKEVKERCDKCGCIFAYERGDIHSDMREGGTWVICPTCKNRILIEINDYMVLF